MGGREGGVSENNSLSQHISVRSATSVARRAGLSTNTDILDGLDLGQDNQAIASRKLEVKILAQPHNNTLGGAKIEWYTPDEHRIGIAADLSNLNASAQIDAHHHDTQHHKNGGNSNKRKFENAG